MAILQSVRGLSNETHNLGRQESEGEGEGGFHHGDALHAFVLHSFFFLSFSILRFLWLVGWLFGWPSWGRGPKLS